MFKRPHHQRIAALLERLDRDLLHQTACYFGGGTALAMQLDEYRESVDIDFLCASQDGYRRLRSIIFDQGLAGLFIGRIELLRDVRADQYGIRSFILEAGIPIKFEIVREARIELCGEDVPGIPVPCLARVDAYAEKLLANADRHADRATLSRDIIDLAAMIRHWGPIPDTAWGKAEQAYGDSVRRAYVRAQQMLTEDKVYFSLCMKQLDIAPSFVNDLLPTLSH